MLRVHELTVRLGGRTILDRATATVPVGQRVALIGRNGAGKSTLLRVIAADLAPDGGAVELPSGWRIGWLQQEAPAGESILLDMVLAADRERTALLAEADHADDPQRIAEVHQRLADIGAHAAPARAAAILAGLGFDDDAQRRPCRSFSGGWRMRVALAAILFSAPDLLLLDEPTNYLDLEATLWLDDYLRTYPHTVLLISHDRALLNSVPTGILHLEHGALRFYAGGFDQFEAARSAERDRLQALHKQQETQRRHLQSFVDRFRYKASKARQAQSRIKALERLQPVVPMTADPTVRFDFPQPEPLAPPLIAMEAASVGYDGVAVLRHLSLRIDRDDRIALLGANGNGKSTLVKLLAGRLAPLEGMVKRSPRLRVGYFAQHQNEEFDVSVTPIEQASRFMPDATPVQVRNHLGRFGFSQSKAETPIGKLSGGEKARLLFAMLAREAPHIVLLDEPTNHLDIDSRAALVEALNTYEGAVVLISHDPHLIGLCADRLWLVAEGGCRPFDGDLDDYRRHLAESAGIRRAGKSGGGEPVAASRKDQRRVAAERRSALAPLRHETARQEKLIERLAADKRGLEAALADPTLYDRGTGDRITRLQTDLADVSRRLAAAEESWLALSEQLEAAEVALG